MNMHYILNWQDRFSVIWLAYIGVDTEQNVLRGSDKQYR